MKAAVFVGQGRLAARDWPRPRVGPGELLLRVRGCGLCGSDIAKIVNPATSHPAVFGHELVGDVVEAGEDTAGFSVGDRVVTAHHVPCGDCHYCARGSHSMCHAFKTSSLDPGGFAEFVRVPAPNVRHATFRLPDHLTDEEGTFVEPLACVLRAVERSGVRRGDTAAVVGLGSIGCLFVQLLRRAGATVGGVDPIVDRAALARGLGADVAGADEEVATALRARSGGRGADQVFVTGGGTRVLPWAAALARDGGQVHFFAGDEDGTLPLPLATLYHRELTLTATYSSSPATLGRAFWLLAAGKVEVDRLITHRLPLERLAEGVELMRCREALKVYVTP
ncbi:MAG: alcohol dehydrogenase catalytic domain-containing protein [Candidatus Rokuibacteriota bacterium]